ncbi:GNAT family N-acetyltransferase [Microbacterium sp. G2-8]|uniref:GNAT family N-acetyltransferase n=1 Tax=Microbacterium sp. G2-8 TaxID=2842454 RepID=UPI001C8A3021|nr:GNAT family N-acetyltransferase [Microbacterium sp. G2-8]
MTPDRRTPHDTARLSFREMTIEDLDAMAALLGDPRVMEFYPAPKSRDEAAEWIRRMQERYAEHGFGLWIIEMLDGTFVGDCGLTWQKTNGRDVLEVGYHVRPEHQGQGLATEAARACLEEARRRFAPTELTAIIHPENAASRGVAENLGMTHTEDDHGHDWIVRTVMSVPVR